MSHEHPRGDVPQARRQRDCRAQHPVRRLREQYGGHSSALVGHAGGEITPAQVVLCLLDLKLARLAHDPTHEDSAVDVCGYAALLRELIEAPKSEGE